MLDPPEAEEEDRRAISGSIDKERSAAVIDGASDRDKADPGPES
jgi:hypothetical protein